jgi:hypothetical protein
MAFTFLAALEPLTAEDAEVAEPCWFFCELSVLCGEELLDSASDWQRRGAW